MKRWMTVLCALLTLLSGCTYAAVTSRQDQESYDLYFRERELSAAAGGDALRTEQVYLPEEIDREDTLQTAQALLDNNPCPTETEVREALSGNYCRCGTHYTAVESIMAYIEQMKEERKQ